MRRSLRLCAMLPRRTLAAALAVLLALPLLVLVVWPTGDAGAQDFQAIESYDVQITIDDDGSLLVREEIVYDFGSEMRHGIFRDIPVRLHYDDRYDRILRLSDIEITGSAGTPVDLHTEGIAGGKTRLRIGDAERTISGVHTYVISYRVEGALNAFEDHDELNWNAIGADWDVPIRVASAAVAAPAEVTAVVCFAGVSGSQLPCEGAVVDGRDARFEQRNGFRPFQGLTVVVAFPKGAVPEPAPILEERWSLSRAFTVSRWTVGGAIALAVAVFAIVGRLLWVMGRDRRWAGSAVNAVFGSPDGEVERVPLFGDRPEPLEYTPPDGLRPGQIGTLVDEVAHPLDVTATIIDLAVRGHLKIEELPPEGLLRWFGKADWRLTRLETDDEVQRFEQLLLDGLFESGDEVLISDLRNEFVEHLADVQYALYDDAVARGWFRRSPTTTRGFWLIIGVIVLVVGLLVEAAAIAWTEVALVPLSLPVAGLVLIASHRAMPRRTPKGTAALMRVRGFRRFIETAEEHRARFAEESQLFYEYLPYAIVFGVTERWAKAFEGLADAPDGHEWYSGRTSLGALALVDALDSFTATSSGTIASTPGGSGSSGFGGSVGGGVGGGGGGSW